MERPEEERICGSPASRNLSRQCCASDSFVPWRYRRARLSIQAQPSWRPSTSGQGS